jgi:hypothetical protein
MPLLQCGILYEPPSAFESAVVTNRQDAGSAKKNENCFLGVPGVSAVRYFLD